MYGTTCVTTVFASEPAAFSAFTFVGAAHLDLDERREVARDLARLDDGGRGDVAAKLRGTHLGGLRGAP